MKKGFACVLRLRISDELMEQLVAYATISGMSVSEFTRQLIVFSLEQFKILDK